MGSDISEPRAPCSIFHNIRTRFTPQHRGPHTPLDRAAGLQRHLTVLRRQVNDIGSFQAASVSALPASGPNTSLTGTWR